MRTYERSFTWGDVGEKRGEAEWVQWLVRGPPVTAPQPHPVLEGADAQEGGRV